MSKTTIKWLNYLKCILLFGLVFIVLESNVQRAVAAGKDEPPYLIKVNRYHNTITIYERNEDGYYIKPVKAMVCSVGKSGTPTRLGTFQTKEKYRWKILMGNVWGQYSTRIVGGILFHSVYYTGYKNPATLATAQYNKLGTAASHGCIRLTVEDAKWIYDNCPVGTTVVIYDDKKSPGPLGKPEAIKIPASAKWDPTDPSSDNPYKNAKPAISGVKDKKIKWGTDIDLLKGIKAVSSLGTDITKDIIVDGKIDTKIPGKYNITYTVTDALKRTSSSKITITVGECPGEPRFEGIGDRVISKGTKVNRTFALKGVTAFCGDIKIKKDSIEVDIKRTKSYEYRITYTIKSIDNVTLVESAFFYIDSKAPEFSGISDRILEKNYVPDETFALKGVSVSDDYAKLKKKDIKVTIVEQTYDKDKDIHNGGAGIDEIPEELPSSTNSSEEISSIGDSTGTDISKKSYLVTYEAEDLVGNKAKKTVLFHY